MAAPKGNAHPRRKGQTENSTATSIFVSTPAEKESYHALADYESISLNELVRRALAFYRAALVAQGKKPPRKRP